ncbi:MAG: hypothetical protein OEW04_06555 [Nitrospirota bacterium]|nr:hypothetical protein [Nitrospirota bacterium]
MGKINCWEYKKCCSLEDSEGKENFRKCIVPEMTMYDGVHGGKNAGRVCWLIADTTCNSEIQSTFAKKLKHCSVCDFYSHVEKEEGDRLEMPMKILENLVKSTK